MDGWVADIERESPVYHGWVSSCGDGEDRWMGGVKERIDHLRPPLVFFVLSKQMTSLVRGRLCVLEGK